ncbi:uncharacterized protein BDV14DRAFT_203172 [Aspergillus stella-maris]|uniref:uncharacterized protein n=1 Tax=Aspergillus stella-maris TaxID=1810926 RepID=UPI003CCD54A4
MAPTYQTRTIAGITVYDTPLITAAISYAKEQNDKMSFNHVYRSWLFGCLIAPKVPTFKEVDLEVHAVAAILHDLAWDYRSPLATKDKRFEVDSANAARDFLKSKGADFDERQVQIVWDSIALHTTPSIAQHKEAEVALCSLGITGDLMGPGLPGGLITKEEYNAVIAEVPTLNMKEGIKNLLCGICVHKPGTTYDNFVRDFGESYVEGYSSEGKLAVDFLMGPIES